MLVLSRKAGERIFILNSDGDPDIVITAVETRGGRVSIGIDAPESYAILREEVAAKKETDLSKSL